MDSRRVIIAMLTFGIVGVLVFILRASDEVDIEIEEDLTPTPTILITESASPTPTEQALNQI